MLCVYSIHGHLTLVSIVLGQMNFLNATVTSSLDLSMVQTFLAMLWSVPLPLEIERIIAFA